MKKLFVSAVAGLAMLGLALPAAAMDHEFGGYWRTRAVATGDFNNMNDASYVDTRTRLFYTAKFSDNLKFVNKFEFNTVWGDDDGGDISADGKNDWRIKNSYVDMTFGDWNATVGIQGGVIARGFLFDDDFSGAVVTYKAAGFDVPVMWIKHTEGSYGGAGSGDNDYDVDYLVVNPTVALSDQLSLNPVFMWVRSEDASQSNGFGVNFGFTPEDVNLFYLGLNADMDFGMGSAWFTGIYQFGSIDHAPLAGSTSTDVKAYLVALGGNVDLGAFNVHGEMFYASGNDSGSDYEQFFVPAGQSYYWSEIMGLGTFDNYGSNGSPEDAIGNIMAFNLGASMSPIEKLTVTADIWYAQLAEKDINGEDELGTELNLKASYKLMDNLNVDVVGAYLFAGDATGKDDPWLVGTQLSLKF
ncbi:hypothetical protein OOT00_11520 [Desulfobotulus sp. H1]|uniref:Alginate export domain-containing protein n=1 Tax=Desulfobotulus pelophilus TaxID=2823377 RepID=A0ABT3NAW9_9BACT|nr:hypothetical protein [Desulfobotulus pelophilus]MCW7754613.1 hypothetical protein [Desulfobotulus pelophilus]